MGSPLSKMTTGKNKRADELITSFVDGYAEGWFMAVGEQFRNELDIKYTKRVVNKVDYYKWTQGPYFCFAEGQVFYDSPYGYSHWREALNKIKLACKIVEAKPNALSADELVDSKRTINKGYVKFNLYEPNSERTFLIKIKEFELPQDDFVFFLQTGKVKISPTTKQSSRYDK